MLKKLALAVVVVVIAIVVFIASKPDVYTVERALPMQASPEIVFATLSSAKGFMAINPWAKLDPNETITYFGPDSGQGSGYRWKGNDEVGSGEMEVLVAKPNELVDWRLEFKEPFASKATTAFSIKPSGAATTVTWTMRGEANFLSKLFGTFFDMEGTLGAQFLEGLENLKAHTEKLAAAAPTSAPASAPVP